MQQLRYEGFIVSRWLDRWMEGITQMAQWIREGKIKTEETVVEGFENMPEAFKGLFTGANKGKMVVKAQMEINSTQSELKISPFLERFFHFRFLISYNLDDTMNQLGYVKGHSFFYQNLYFFQNFGVDFLLSSVNLTFLPAVAKSFQIRKNVKFKQRMCRFRE